MRCSAPMKRRTTGLQVALLLPQVTNENGQCEYYNNNIICARWLLLYTRVYIGKYV